MSLTSDAQATLLLSAQFAPLVRGEPNPLTPSEYERFSTWLGEQHFTPQDLLDGSKEVLAVWQDPKGKITQGRLEALLGRGVAMGIALDRWNNAGIWVITRADADYPTRLQKKLGPLAPPLVFGVGNRKLLECGGLAIVGSRALDDAECDYARHMAEAAAQSGLNVVSGGAKGADQIAMLGALEVEGTAVGVLANGLLGAALAKQWRPGLRSEQLCLIATCSPEAPFHVGNAMGRNKYVYCLADHGLVVRAEHGTGGTWAGATEALKKNLAPLFVNPGSAAAGIAELKKIGASDLPLPPDGQNDSSWLPEVLSGSLEKASVVKEEALVVAGPEPAVESASNGLAAPLPGKDIFYQRFIELLEQTLQQQESITLMELRERFTDLGPKQIQDWLARAVDQGVLNRPGRLHRYVLPGHSNEQLDLFSDPE